MDNKENIELNNNLNKQPLADAEPHKVSEKISAQTLTTKEEKGNVQSANAKPSSSSLQDHFKKFKKQRHEKFKYNQYLKNIRIKDRGSKEFQDYLRNKFVETAKKYLGVPYAKRYLKPGDKNYDAPIFLDCCGLVRQVVYDLREEFGFTLARWNQSYQIDTLPINLKFEELKPGDLIFYSGTYYTNSHKKQKHDMTHVEIYLGGETGEQTIGARYNNGVVSYFDSYKFTSKTYYDIKFYYKSLDTWLQGICKSVCEEHAWIDDRDLWVPDKFSVFATDEEKNANDEDMESGPNDDGKECCEQEIKTPSTAASVKTEVVTLGEKLENGGVKVFVGKGNNDKLLQKYFTSEKFSVLDKKLAFSNKYDIKWVQTSAEIDFLSFKEGQQLVNHIPNMSMLTSKNGLIQTLRDYETAHSKDAATDTIKMNDFMSETYRLDILSDEIAFLNSSNEGVWIAKPYHTNQGKNIRLFTDIKKFKQAFIKTKKFYLGEYFTSELSGLAKEIAYTDKDKKTTTVASTTKTASEVTASNTIQEVVANTIESVEPEFEIESVDSKTIMQKYIENPLLLENRKFDIRCYMLIASTKPLLVLFHHGYIRLSLNPYSTEFEGKSAQITHLTNNSVQKKHPDYYTNKENSIWGMNKFEEYLEKDLKISKEAVNNLYAQIKKILTYTITCSESKLDKKTGFFELLGCDILVDSNLKPYLLEINTNPALFTDTKSQADIIPTVVNKTLDVVLQLNQDPENIGQLVKDPKKLDLGTFEVLYQEKQ
jgi:hypothetical protein